MGPHPSPLLKCLWHQVRTTSHGYRQIVIALVDQEVIVIINIKIISMKWLSLLLTRRYRHGAWLATHTDRLSTHVISAIVHLGHKVLGVGVETHKGREIAASLFIYPLAIDAPVTRIGAGGA